MGPIVEGLVLITLLGIVAWQWMERRQVVGRLEQLAKTDDLTGLANDRSFREALAPGIPGLILLDLDRFKPFNDAHGHPAGDEALREVGSILRTWSRAFRLGGDEFALILDSPDPRLARDVAERLLQAIRDHPWPLRPITVSLGVATRPLVDSDSIRHCADAALYQAKREGGDRVCVYDRRTSVD